MAIVDRQDWFVTMTRVGELAWVLARRSTPALSWIFNIATVIPSVAVAARRLHDTDRSGWWQLLAFVPIIGWILLLIWMCQRGTSGSNRFGWPT